MTTYVQALDELVAVIAAAAPGVRVTRDPSTVVAPCVLVGFPSGFAWTQGARELFVPVSLLHKSPADVAALDWLLNTYETLGGLIGQADLAAAPYVIGSATYPSVSVTVTLTLTN